MILSRQQQYILEILNRLGCAQKRQLDILLAARFFPEGKAPPDCFTDILLRQLAFCNVEVRADGDVLFLRDAARNVNMPEAIDVMIELSRGKPRDFCRGDAEPVLLRFAAEGEARFAVLNCGGAAHTSVRGPPRFLPDEIAVVLISDKSDASPIRCTDTQYYALRRQDGTHRFFRAE